MRLIRFVLGAALFACSGRAIVRPVQSSLSSRREGGWILSTPPVRSARAGRSPVRSGSRTQETRSKASTPR